MSPIAIPSSARLSGRALRVLVLLHALADERGQVALTIADLAERISCSAPTVARAIGELQRRGLVERRRVQPCWVTIILQEVAGDEDVV
ncbi:MAG: helix-turn-helix domain-containing protein [Planctomycetes bacterium]|nr:helix-turn-helix domain-containing protein [Planctomycetota bacterium]